MGRRRDRVPKNYLLRRIDVFVTAALADLHEELEPHYSDIGRPSVDPERMIRMLIVGGTATASAPSAGYARRSGCTSPMGGSVGSTSTIRSRITRRCRSIGSGASARATSCATSSSASCARRWPQTS
jgi:hypothetical protein